MQTFVEGITITRKYQLQNQEMIKPSHVDKRPFGWEREESCVTLQQASNRFFSDRKLIVRTSLDYYK